MVAFRTRTQLYRAFGAKDDLSLRKQLFKRTKGKVWIQVATVRAGYAYESHQWRADYKLVDGGLIRATNFARDGVAIRRSRVSAAVTHGMFLRNFRGASQYDPSPTFMTVRDWNRLAVQGCLVNVETIDEKTKRLTWSSAPTKHIVSTTPSKSASWPTTSRRTSGSRCKRPSWTRQSRICPRTPWLTTSSTCSACNPLKPQGERYEYR